MTETFKPKTGAMKEHTGKATKKTTVFPAIPLDEDVYTLAKRRMQRIYDEFDHVAVSFSGGKDSTAVLNIALEVAKEEPRNAHHLPLRVIFFDEEAVATQTHEYMTRIEANPDIALEWYCLPVKHRAATTRKVPYWYPWAPEAQEKWCRPLPKNAITTVPGFPIWPAEERLDIPTVNGLLAPPQLGNVALVMGIRAQESMTRRRAVSRKRVDNYLVKYDSPTSRGNVWKAYPVYDWTTEDVWTAAKQLGWDHNYAYDHMEMMGMPHSAQRCSPPFGEEPLGTLSMWAECFPDLWDKMVDRIPGVATAARYSTTELWAYKKLPLKPEGMDWSTFLLFYVNKFPKDVRLQIGKRLTDTVNVHYRKTSQPITVTTNHPISGVSWNYLLRIAMRGDFKQRNPPAYKLRMDEHGRTVAVQWKKYIDELREILEDGTFGDLAYTGKLPNDLTEFVPDYAKDAL